MSYTDIINRSDAQALVPEEVVYDMLQRTTQQSAVLSLFRRIPVARNQQRFPILQSLPVAYWVQGDTGLKQTTDVTWTNKYMNIEEIATIMPVPDNVVADTEINVWDEAVPYLTEALGRLLDNSVFFGVGAPSSFPTCINAAAVSAGNTVTEGTADAAHGGYFGDLDSLIATVEADGYDISGFAAARSARGKLRAARSTLGERLDQDRISPKLDELDGSPIVYPMRGLFPTALSTGTNTRVFGGDFSQYVVGVRSDVTMKVLDQAVIQDNTGAIIYNLAQQDMTAIRLTFRVGWQVANIVNYDQPDETQRYPVGVLRF